MLRNSEFGATHSFSFHPSHKHKRRIRQQSHLQCTAESLKDFSLTCCGSVAPRCVDVVLTGVLDESWPANRGLTQRLCKQAMDKIGR